MKAPDKIYIEIDGNRVHTYFGLQPEKAVEYIRKDALIDALNKILDARPPEAKGPASTIAAMVFQQLIERVKSL